MKYIQPMSIAIVILASTCLQSAVKPERRHVVICKQPGRYIGWPTIAQAEDGAMFVAFSGNRAAHVCPHGETQLVRSRDGGATWSEPVTINDGPLDDRDTGVLVTSEGTVIVNWFTSLAFEQRNSKRWRKTSAKITDAEREEWLGNWLLRSSDGGRTWAERIDSIVSSPHGPIELSNGRLLHLGVNRRNGSDLEPPAPPGKRIAAVESRDDGRTWQIKGYVPIPEGVAQNSFHEPHLVETDDGRLTGMLRHHGKPGDRVLWHTESSDGGRHWTEARPTDIRGLPPHLIRLTDGRILVTYGHRRKPYGQRACISKDGGRNWDIENEIIIRDDAPNGDLGYPASLQIDDSTVLTVYYQVDKPGEKTCLMGTFWKIP